MLSVEKQFVNTFYHHSIYAKINYKNGSTIFVLDHRVRWLFKNNNLFTIFK